MSHLGVLSRGSVAFKSLIGRYDLIIASGIPTNLIEIMMKDFRTYFKRIFSPVTDLQQVNKTPEFHERACKALGTVT